MEQQEGNIGFKQLRELREETIKRWKEAGFPSNIKDNIAELYDCCTSYEINDDKKINNDKSR